MDAQPRTDAKTLAAQIRRTRAAAVRDPQDVLYGLTVSVRTGGGSMSSSVVLAVQDDVAHYRQPRETPDAWGNETEWTPRALAISARLHQLAAPALAWADDRMHFCEIMVGGTALPAPTTDLAAAAEEDDSDPRCPAGHGPMPARERMTKDARALGAWHDCRRPGCTNSYLAPSPDLARFLAEQAALATGDAAAPAVELGARRGQLAAVRTAP